MPSHGLRRSAFVMPVDQNRSALRWVDRAATIGGLHRFWIADRSGTSHNHGGSRAAGNLRNETVLQCGTGAALGQEESLNERLWPPVRWR